LKEFITAVEKAEETEEGSDDLVFMIDDQEVRAFKPTEGQFALLMMAMGRHATEADQFAGVVDFFFNVLDEPSQAYVSRRMMSRDQLIPMEQVVEILQWMIEEWGGRPFQRPSGSTSSQRNGGRKSTGTTRRSTSSASHPIAS
jgi:hypothetical protein